MKKLTFAITMAISIHASAAFLGARYSDQQQASQPRCAVRTCLAQDNGAGFHQYCKMTRTQIMPNLLPVLVWYEGAQPNCFCPCQFDFEDQVHP